jgi:hypothetical protein
MWVAGPSVHNYLHGIEVISLNLHVRHPAIPLGGLDSKVFIRAHIIIRRWGREGNLLSSDERVSVPVPLIMARADSVAQMSQEQAGLLPLSDNHI